MPARPRRAARCGPMKEKVLVIDDEEAIRKSLRMVLEYEGYEFLEAASGREGIEAVRRDTPDAVLLDIKMPGMDGLEALDAIRAKDAHTPILIISGHGDIPTAVEAIQKGAYDFLEKPLESERVLTALRNAIERKRLRQENLRLRHQVEASLRLVGESKAMKGVREAIARAAPAHAKVRRGLENGGVEPVGMAKTSRVDVRVIAATNKDLRERIHAGAFREDLFFRLNVLPIVCPSLRERREDVPALLDYFVETFTSDSSYRPKRFSPAAVERLAARPWRGNARELRNAVERLLIMVER